MNEPLSRIVKHKKKDTKKPVRKKKWLLIFSILFFILGSTGAAAYWKFSGFLQTIQADGEPAASPSVAKAETVYSTDKPLSILLLGKDTRGKYGGGLTDVIIIATLNPQTGKVTMLSIPRDTGVVLPGETKDQKINFVYKRGELDKEEDERAGKAPKETGISLLKKTLESIYGIPIHNYVMVDFEGFRKGIDALGGVELKVDRRLIYNDPTDGTAINLYPGVQHLDGDQALDFVRHRHDDRGLSYYSTDYERNDRQVALLRAALNQVKSVSGFTKIFGVMDVADDHIKTDLSFGQMKGILTDFGKMDPNQIVKLENTGVEWDAANSRTVIPLATLTKNRLALQQSMGIDPSTVTTYNDSPAGSGSKSSVKKRDASSDEKDEKKATKKSESDEPKKRTSSQQSSEEKDKKEEQKSSGTKESTESDKEEEPLLDPDKPVSESIEMKEAPDPTGPTAPAKPNAPTAPEKIEVKLESSEIKK